VAAVKQRPRKPLRKKRDSVLALLDAVAADSVGTDNAAVAEEIGRGSRPVHGTDPEFPGMVVRIDPSGARTPGRFENRRFVSAA
jgi:hypothetical protein